VPKAGFGYYVPPIGGGEEALVNILPVKLPAEVFVSSTPHTPKKAAPRAASDAGMACTQISSGKARLHCNWKNCRETSQACMGMAL
jgi:hypothetical protein